MKAGRKSRRESKRNSLRIKVLSGEEELTDSSEEDIQRVLVIESEQQMVESLDRRGFLIQSQTEGDNEDPNDIWNTKTQKDQSEKRKTQPLSPMSNNQPGDHFFESQDSVYLDQSELVNQKSDIFMFKSNVVPFQGFENVTKTDYVTKVRPLTVYERINMLRFNFNLGKSNVKKSDILTGTISDFSKEAISKLNNEQLSFIRRCLESKEKKSLSVHSSERRMNESSRLEVSGRPSEAISSPYQAIQGQLGELKNKMRSKKRTKRNKLDMGETTSCCHQQNCVIF